MFQFVTTYKLNLCSRQPLFCKSLPATSLQRSNSQTSFSSYLRLCFSSGNSQKRLYNLFSLFLTMPTEQLPPMNIRYSGLFDFDGLYAAVVDWAKNYGYLWHEMNYKHKVPSPKGAEQELMWIISQQVTEYIKFEMIIQVHTWDHREVEVDINGQKKKLTNARIHILMEGTLTADWQKKFATGGKLGQKLGGWYFQRVYRREFYNHFDELHYRMLNLHALLKKYFEMQTQKNVYKGYLGED